MRRIYIGSLTARLITSSQRDISDSIRITLHHAKSLSWHLCYVSTSISIFQVYFHPTTAKAGEQRRHPYPVTKPFHVPPSRIEFGLVSLDSGLDMAGVVSRPRQSFLDIFRGPVLLAPSLSTFTYRLVSDICSSHHDQRGFVGLFPIERTSCHFDVQALRHCHWQIAGRVACYADERNTWDMISDLLYRSRAWTGSSGALQEACDETIGRLGRTLILRQMIEALLLSRTDIWRWVELSLFISLTVRERVSLARTMAPLVLWVLSTSCHDSWSTYHCLHHWKIIKSCQFRSCSQSDLSSVSAD